jgi:hypothetical protein
MDVAAKKTAAQFSLEEVLSLLRAKNRCLERIHALCATFLERWPSLANAEAAYSESTESTEFTRSNELARFQQRRESYFHILDLYDKRISDALRCQPKAHPLDPINYSEKIDAVLEERSQIVRAIMNQDGLIMAELESEKTRLFDELTGTRRNQTLVSKFKSSWVPESGEELDQKL